MNFSDKSFLKGRKNARLELSMQSAKWGNLYPK